MNTLHTVLNGQSSHGCRAGLCVLALILNVLGPGAGQAAEEKQPILTGTVNIVLANANGIIALTDSNQTEIQSNGEVRTSPIPGQKLFQIDDRTVCTIAGFGATALPNFPDLTSSAAGVIDKYVDDLKRKGGEHSFREKLTSLEFLFDLQLSGIGNLQHLTPEEAGRYGIEFILAGYDSDGTARIGKAVLDTNLSPNGSFSPVLKVLSEKTVGTDFAYETAGIGAAAVENILRYPEQLRDDPDIARYAKSKSAHATATLSLVEMEGIARALSHHAALVNSHYVNFSTVWWPVGGRNQVAVLKRGSEAHFDQQMFERRKVNRIPFGIIQGVTLSNGGRPDVIVGASASGTLGLFIKMRFIGTVLLDNGYFFDDDFKDGMLYYDGGVLGFESNQIANCTLRLGPHARKDSPTVKRLLAGFAWKQVEYRALF